VDKDNRITISDQINVDYRKYALYVIQSRGIPNFYDALTPVTAAVFNYMRNPNTPAVKTNEIFPWINEYSTNPDNDVNEKEIVSNGLLGFMSQAKGFKLDRFANAKLN
jgi:hypothetical protein